MAHKVVNFKYHAGDDKPIDVQLLEADGVTPIPGLTGATEIRFAVANFLTDAAALFTRTKTGGHITIVDEPTAMIRISMIKTDTVGLGGTYEHELELVLAGLDETLWTGQVEIEPTVLD